MKKGHVYFVSAPGRIKIGYTTKPERRLQQLQSVDMEILTVIGTVPGSRKAEAELHANLSQFNIRGEWFIDCADVRSVIEAFLSAPPVDRAEDYAPRQSMELRNDNVVSAARNAIQEAREICSKIEAAVTRGENVSELVRNAAFLTEQIIVPLLSGERA